MKQLVGALLLGCLLFGGAVAGWAATPVATKASTAAHAAVNVNTADAKQLVQLPGIGKVTAGKVLAYRQAHGPFAKADDLLRVDGIGPKTLEKIRPLISLK